MRISNALGFAAGATQTNNATRPIPARWPFLRLVRPIGCEATDRDVPDHQAETLRGERMTND
jgi:hypothetical protein